MRDVVVARFNVTILLTLPQQWFAASERRSGPGLAQLDDLDMDEEELEEEARSEAETEDPTARPFFKSRRTSVSRARTAGALRLAPSSRFFSSLLLLASSPSPYFFTLPVASQVHFCFSRSLPFLLCK